MKIVCFSIVNTSKLNHLILFLQTYEESFGQTHPRALPAPGSDVAPMAWNAEIGKHITC